jgi:hypothetical protein
MASVVVQYRHRSFPSIRSLEAVRIRCEERTEDMFRSTVNTGVSAAFSIGLGLVGCGGQANSPATDDTDPAAVPAVTEAPAIIENGQGQTFRRVDLWQANEVERIFEDAKSDDSVPLTAEKLAAQMRGVMLAEGETYIAEELPIEMAQRVLLGEAPQYAPGASVSQGRFIWGYDNRNMYSGEQFVAFSEKGCTGTLSGFDTAVTGAHCVFNSGHVSSTEGWLCDNNSVGHAGEQVSGTSWQMSFLAPNCRTNPNRRYASWRFGVAGLSGISPWLTPGSGGCIHVIIPSAFVSDVTAADFSTNIPKVARWDYAILDIHACTTFNPTFHMAVRSMTDAQLLNASVVNDGYPLRAGCGNSGSGRIECSSATTPSYLNASGQPTTTAPYAGATRWIAFGDDVGAGASFAADTIRVTVTNPATDHTLDNSSGMSGGPLYLAPWAGGGDLCANGPGCLIGTATGSNSNGVNYFHRWNVETFNFFSNYSVFPNDI